jgi:hypothetical protein
MAEKITPRSEDYSQWYNDLVKQAGLAEHSAVKGCMVIKPGRAGSPFQGNRACECVFSPFYPEKFFE